MGLQSKLIISFILLILVVWLLRYFFNKRLSSGQTLFWLLMLVGAEVFTLFPGLVDRITVFWGNLVPVSWISFVGLVVLIFYLIYLSTRLNAMKSRFAQLARSLAFVEKRLRETQSRDESPADDSRSQAK
jgi:hypothetical protein